MLDIGQYIKHQSFQTLLYFIILCIWMLCLVFRWDRRRHQVAWNWSYRWMRVTEWVLGIKLISSGRTDSALTCWTICPYPQNLEFVKIKKKKKQRTTSMLDLIFFFCLGEVSLQTSSNTKLHFVQCSLLTSWHLRVLRTTVNTHLLTFYIQFLLYETIVVAQHNSFL